MRIGNFFSLAFMGKTFIKPDEVKKEGYEESKKSILSLDLMGSSMQAFVSMEKAKNIQDDTPIAYSEKEKKLQECGIKSRNDFHYAMSLPDENFLNLLYFLKKGKTVEQVKKLVLSDKKAIEERAPLLDLGFDDTDDLLEKTFTDKKLYSNIMKFKDYDVKSPKIRYVYASNSNGDTDSAFVNFVKENPNVSQDDAMLASLLKNRDVYFECLKEGIKIFDVETEKNKKMDKNERKIDSYKDTLKCEFYGRKFDKEKLIKYAKLGLPLDCALNYSSASDDRFNYVMELIKNSKKFNIDRAASFAVGMAGDVCEGLQKRMIAAQAFVDSKKDAMKIHEKLISVGDEAFEAFVGIAKTGVCEDLKGLHSKDLSNIAKIMQDDSCDALKAYFKYKYTGLEDTIMNLVNNGASESVAVQIAENNPDDDLKQKILHYDKYFDCAYEIAKDEQASKMADYFVENVITGDDEKDEPARNFYSLYEKNPKAAICAFDYIKEGYNVKIAMYCAKHGYPKEKMGDIIKLIESGVAPEDIDLVVQGENIYGKKITNEEDRKALFELMKNGIKADISSIMDAAKSLNMPVFELTKYLTGGAYVGYVECIISEYGTEKEDLVNFFIMCAENDYSTIPLHESYFVGHEGLLDTKEKIGLAKELLKRGVYEKDTADAVCYAQLEYKDDKQLDRLAELYKLGASKVDAYIYSRNEEEYKYMRSICLEQNAEKRSENDNFLQINTYIMKKANVDFDTAQKIFSAHLKHFLRLHGRFEDIDLEKISKYAKEKNIDIDFALIFDRYPSKIKKLENLLNKGYTPKMAQIMAYVNLNENDTEKIALVDKIINGPFLKDIKDKVKNPNIEKQTESIFSSVISEPEMIKKLLNSGMSYDEIIDGASKFAKNSLKLAMKRPNQYLCDIPPELTTKVNGKYPSLKGNKLRMYQDMFCNIIKTDEILPEVIKMAHCLDSDTFNQIMDKRTEALSVFINEFEILEKDDRKLLSELLSLKSSAGKPLTAKEKIDIIRILLGYKNAQIKFDDLKNLENLDISKLKKDTLQKTFELIGIDKEKFESINKDKLNFDNEYVHLILKSDKNEEFNNFWSYYILPMQNSEEEYKEKMNELEMFTEDDLAAMGFDAEAYKQICEILRKNPNVPKNEIRSLAQKLFVGNKGKNGKFNLSNVIKMATFGDFKTEIQDTSNEIGKVNNNTKKQFKLNRLNYDTWINRDEKFDKDINLNGKDFKITMWNRNPQRDLFLGNRTSCCTALGEINGSATPVYLLNTAFNVVEMKDDKGNTVAMSRIFMANVDNNPSLIMDNIEVNQEFMKYLDTENQHNVVKGFSSYMHDYAKEITNNDDTKVYLSKSFSKLDTSKLTNVNKKINFIGDMSNDTLYMNAAQDWISLKKMQNLSASFYEV